MTTVCHPDSGRVTASFVAVQAPRRWVDICPPRHRNRYSVAPQLAGSVVTVRQRLGDPFLDIATPSGVVVARQTLAPADAGVMVRDQVHVAALEHAAMAAFTTTRPHRRKERIPISPEATAVLPAPAEAPGSHSEVVIDLAAYAATWPNSNSPPPPNVCPSSWTRPGKKNSPSRPPWNVSWLPRSTPTPVGDWPAGPGSRACPPPRGSRTSTSMPRPGSTPLFADLETCRYLEPATNLLLIGPPGVGKTMLSVGLARAAIEGRWATTMRFFAGPSLLVIDELCCLSMPAEAASPLFQVVS